MIKKIFNTKKRVQSIKQIHQPLLSVIIPAYNAEGSLRKCLQSILKQSFNNFEIIVVDNNSTDKTKFIINEFRKKDKRIKYAFEHFRSRGAARNAGIKVSRGDIIVNTNCDSVVPVNWLEKFVSAFIPRINAVQGVEKTSGRNLWVREHLKSTREFRNRKLSKPDKQYIDLVDFENFALRKSIIETLGFYDRFLKNLDDIDFRLRLKQGNIKIRYLKDCYVYQKPPANLKSTLLKQIDRGYWAKKILNKHPSFKDEEELQVSSYTVFLMFFISLPLFFIRNGFKKGIYELVTGTGWRIGIIKALL